MTFGNATWQVLNSHVFPDPARPVEFIAVAGLGGWTVFLAFHPETLSRAAFSGFAALPVIGWQILMGLTALTQFAVIVAPVPGRAVLRFAAMTLASGLWTVVAFNFWGGLQLSTGAGMYTAIAAISALTGVWLGCLTIKS